jgi:aspartate/methionine/tyrosine aminotransferase
MEQADEAGIELDLACSTGPNWTLDELIKLMDEEEHARFLDARVVYSSNKGSEALRKEIATLHGVSPDHVRIVTGAAEALLILFFLAAEEGANVVVPFPAFTTFSAEPKALGLEVRPYHLRPENDFRIDVDEIKRLVDSRTKLLLINSPHNPTGSIISPEDLRSLHDFAADRGIQFVADEVYHPIYHGQELSSATSLPGATVLGDLSKALCLSGLRVGWIIERDPDRLDQYFDARAYFTVSNSPVCEALATVALRRRDQVYDRARRIATRNLQLLDDFFSEEPDIFGWVRPSGGFTAFPWLKQETDARRFCRALLAEGISIAPGDCFGMPAHFRIGFGGSGERFPAAMEKLRRFTGQYFEKRKVAP